MPPRARCTARPDGRGSAAKKTGINKMTVRDLRAYLAYHDVKRDGTKDKKGDLVTLTRAAA